MRFAELLLARRRELVVQQRHRQVAVRLQGFLRGVQQGAAAVRGVADAVTTDCQRQRCLGLGFRFRVQD